MSCLLQPGQRNTSGRHDYYSCQAGGLNEMNLVKNKGTTVYIEANASVTRRGTDLGFAKAQIIIRPSVLRSMGASKTFTSLRFSSSHTTPLHLQDWRYNVSLARPPSPSDNNMMTTFVPRTVFPTLESLPRSYYLGHHAAGLSKMRTMLSQIDLIVECRDYRVPLTSRNPLFEETLAGRERMVVYTKRDLGSSGGVEEMKV